MKLRDAFKTSYKGLVHAKMRSFLTMLGIVIGVASVILLMSLGASAQQYILGQVQNIGSNLVFVIPGATKGSRVQSPASAQGIVITTLNQADVDSFQKEPSISGVTPIVRGVSRVIYGNNDTSVTYQGVSADFFKIQNMKVTEGSAFTNEDSASFNHVAVIGVELAKTLFGGVTPVGKMIRLQNITFRVVGVLEKKGMGPGGVDQDNLVLMPVTVAQKQLLGITYYSMLEVQANDTYTVPYVKSRMTSILRENHRVTNPDKDDFTIRSQEDALEILSTITNALTAFLAAIAAISLVVGGIGIMNIMFVSVVERTREIGLRKAVGATTGDVLQQFLIEATMLTFIGGVIGIALGIGIAALAYVVLVKIMAVDWTLSIPISAVLLGVGVSTLTGLVFGIYPARQASVKNPIEALRYE